LGRIAHHIAVPVYAKLENLNPGGSIKDRVGLNIIEGAEKRGELKPGGTVVKQRPVIPVWACHCIGAQRLQNDFCDADKMSNEKIQYCAPMVPRSSSRQPRLRRTIRVRIMRSQKIRARDSQCHSGESISQPG